jgi:carbonic anhydrase
VLQTDPDIALLLHNNERWVASENEKDPLYFKKIGAPQRPKYFYIGCSDSRVPVNQILGVGPGEVFVHRNVGNQVIGSDLNVLSGLEYAVNALNVEHIIVTGHYDCGAVRAATKTQDLGLVEHWLRSLRDIYRNHYQTLDVIENEEERHRKFVEVAVVEQCLNLYKTGVVQKKRMENHKNGKRALPRIHAMVFDPKVGILKKLPIDFKRSVGQFRHIYDLY